MTDGISQDSVRRPSLALKSQGVRVFALGIGRRYRRNQLQQIATNSRHVFTGNFRSLNRVARRISTKLCRSKFNVLFLFSKYTSSLRSKSTYSKTARNRIKLSKEKYTFKMGNGLSKTCCSNIVCIFLKIIERFSLECRETKTKAITMATHNKRNNKMNQ